MLKRVPEYPEYSVDEKGNIFSHLRIRFLNTTRHQKHGRMVDVFGSIGKHKNVRVSYMVLTTFVSPRPKGMIILHGKNGLFDDSLENLSWGTHKQNHADKWRDGTQQVGERVGTHKLNELQVRIIRRAYAPNIKRTHIDKGIPTQQLAEIFNVSTNTIERIVNRESWKHI